MSNTDQNRSSGSSESTITSTNTTRRTVRPVAPELAQRLRGWHNYDWMKTIVAAILAILLLFGRIDASAGAPVVVVPTVAPATLVPAKVVPTVVAATAVPATAAPAPTAAPTAAPAAAPGSAGMVELTVAYTQEKEAWLLPQIDAYNKAGFKTADGATIRVKPMLVDSAGSTADGLRQNKPDVWFPASSLDVAPVAAAWQQANGAALSTAAPISIMRSPIMIAMWEPMARHLGWPDTQPTWQQLAGLSGKSWADAGGQAAWGQFRFAHPTPDQSTLGVAGMLAPMYAAMGKTSGLTVDDLNTVQLRSVLNPLVDNLAGDGSAVSGTSMLDCATPITELSAALLYEQQIATQPTCPDRPRIVAIYPENGTLVADHPFVVLNGAWVDQSKQAAAQDLQAWLLRDEQQQSALQAGFRPIASTVALAAPISDATGVNPALPATTLEVPAAELLTQAGSYWARARKVVDVVIVVDTSGSMAGENKIDGVRAGLADFVQALGPRDRLQIITFSDTIRNVLPMAPVAEKRAEALAIAEGLTPRGATALYDVTLEAFKQLQANGDPAHARAIVLLTDGRDERIAATGQLVPGSKATLEEALAGAQAGSENGKTIRLFTIGYGAGADNTVLKQIADAAGGTHFTAGTAAIQEIYQTIALFL